MLKPARPHRNKPKDDVSDIIEQEARAVAMSFGIHASEALAAALIERLRYRIGGEQVYLARACAQLRRQRIVASFDGSNVDQLARDHGISPRRVRQILSESRAHATPVTYGHAA